MENKLSEVIENLKNQSKYQRIFQETTVIVIRGDGLVLWTNDGRENQATSAVLMGGAWNAAQAIFELRPEYNSLSNKMLRFSFDTSEAGIYIIPVQSSEGCLFMGMLFQNEINPGLLKKEFRQFAQMFGLFLSKGEDIQKEAKENQGGLFSEISDGEIDELFSTVGI